MNHSRIDRLAFLELVAHAVPSVVLVAAAFQITRIGWTGAPDFPTLVADAENAQGERLRRLLSSLTPITLRARGYLIPRATSAVRLRELSKAWIARGSAAPSSCRRPSAAIVAPNAISRTR